jgi:SAM-dependent methyltransferase
VSGPDCICPLCGDALETAALRARDRWFGLSGEFELRECERCRLATTYPQLEGEALARHYPADYDPWLRSDSLLEKLASIPADVRATLPPYGPIRRKAGGALLDVGCGRGDLASRFARAGWRSYGLDNSAAAVASARSVGVDAHEGTLETAPWDDASFDLIIMNHSLEHMPDPVEQLKRVRRLLRPGGQLVVAVPNWQSWQRRLFGTYWTPLDIPRHLTHFSPHALHAAAGRAGFTRGRTRNYATGVGLPVSVWYRLNSDPVRGRRQQALLIAGAALYPLTWLLGRLLGGDATYLVAER